MIEENLARRYLLGQLSAQERQKVEERYFAESNAFEELVASEDDLIDSYARGDLSSAERQQFEQRYFSSPEGRSRVEFAKALGEIVRSRQAEAKNKKQIFWESLQRVFRFGDSLQWAVGAVCAVLCVAVFFLSFRNRELNREIQEARTSEAQLRAQRDEAVGQIASLSQRANNESGRPQAQANIPDLTFTLVGGIVRGESRGEVLTVPKGRPWIRLEMPIDEDTFGAYEATLYTADMRELRREEGLKSRSTAKGIQVAWRIPSDSLQNGDYILQLNGKQVGSKPEALSVYSFRVLHK